MKISKRSKIVAVSVGAAGIVAAVVVPMSANAGTVASPTRFGSNVGMDAQGNIHQCIVSGFVKPNTTLADATGPKGAICYTIKAPGAPAAAPAYGVAQVLIKRGSGAATVWDQTSATLGSPVGATASGAFRFTCSTANAPCEVSVKAYATAAGFTVYPRLDITKQDFNSGAPLGNCEYADGTNNDGGTHALTTAPTDVTLGIGGTLDCGAGSAQSYPTNGIATKIVVPAGYYDVIDEFDFKAAN